jgi:hypothetical protein
MSCFGKGMPPFGHSRSAWSSASCCVGAHETWTCSWVVMASESLPASVAPSRNLPHSMAIFSSAAPTVMIPSAYLPVRFAFSGPAVATRMGTGCSGMV